MSGYWAIGSRNTANDPAKLYFREVDDFSAVKIEGMHPDWKLHGYQNAEVRKRARHFSGINSYQVGLGKTSTAAACVQYVQSIGVKKKTMIVVPNAVLSNWRKELVEQGFTEDQITVLCQTQLGMLWTNIILAMLSESEGE